MIGVRPSSRALLLVMLAAGLLSCSDNDESSAGTETNALDPVEGRPAGCLWELDELLSSVDAPASERTDCGVFLGQQPLDNECFTSGIDAGDAVQITINNCIDCMIHSTYVSTPNAGKFHLYREADYFGDDVRVVRVDSCAGFVAGMGPGANCAGAEALYVCSDPLPAPSSS